MVRSRQQKNSAFFSFVFIWADRPTRLRNTWFGFLALLYSSLMSISLSERPFVYDIMGGSLEISFSSGCCCI